MWQFEGKTVARSVEPHRESRPERRDIPPCTALHDEVIALPVVETGQQPPWALRRFPRVADWLADVVDRDDV